MKSINPATAEPIFDYPELGLHELDGALVDARGAFTLWSGLSLEERAAHVRRVGATLRARKSELGRLMTLEMGKPITQAEGEIEKCAWVCDHFADFAASYLADELVETERSYSGVWYEPLGPILAIMPWNFPFWQVFRCAVPALMAGNVVLLKHAENVTGCSLAIEKVFTDSGFSSGIFRSLAIGREAAQRLVGHPAIRGVALTGSVKAGMEVAAAAGRHLKKCVLELGGSDPFIVLADAELGRAVEAAVQARTINSGQSCIAAKRFIVEAPIAERFEELFTLRMKQLIVGDPLDPETEVGPLARADLRDALHDQVLEALDQRAELACGGDRLERAGFYYRPTVLTGVKTTMRVFEEETFGPVAAVIRADDARHAIALANHPSFGLGASLWTSDLDRARRLAASVQAGSVFVNGIVVSDPRLPFGGIKDSGLGRELGAHGIREFTNVKTVVIS